MALLTNFIWGEILADERERRRLTQQAVASAIGEPNPKTVSRGERGNALPGPYYQRQLCELFDKRPEALGFVPGVYPLYWNVPFPRSPFFTGRANLLSDLQQRFRASRALGTGLQLALSGLAGVGKTQLAVEYAHHYRQFYHTILWVRADTSETLTSDMMKLASVLKLPTQDRDNADPQELISPVKRWLNRFSNWLLILDNVDNMNDIHSLFSLRYSGQILVTTRLQSTGAILQNISVNSLNEEDSARLLLRRARIAEHATENDWQAARDIAIEMGGLPLALNQAGAFIEQAGEQVQSYLNLYRKHGIALLSEPDELNTSPHDPVSNTFDLSLEKVHQRNQQAFNLLQFLAFLSPDAIPVELIAKGTSRLGTQLESLRQNDVKRITAIKDLMTFSLVTRHRESDTLVIHRLVQAVILGKMSKKQQIKWAERTVQAVNQCFPEVVMQEIAHWSLCERFLSQAQVCVALIDRWGIRNAEAAHLIEQLGIYLMQRLNYKEAEAMHLRALAIQEHVYGEQHIAVANTLDHLALCYYFQYDDARSKKLFQRALEIKEQLSGQFHPQLVRTLIWMSHLFYNQDIYSEAESLYKRAQAIVELQSEPDLAQLSSILDGLGLVYFKQGNLNEAEVYLQRTLEINKKRWSSDHPNRASALASLARLYTAQGKYTEAEQYFQEALTIRTKALGPSDPAVTGTLQYMALLQQQQGNYEKAKQLFEQIFAIIEQNFGPATHLLRNAISNYIELLKNAELVDELNIYENRLAEVQAQIDKDQELSTQDAQTSDISVNVRSEIDSLAEFFQSCCELKPDAYSHLSEIWDSYLHWTRSHDEYQRIKRIQTLAQYLRMKGCQPVHTKKQRLWRGVILR